MQKADLTTRAIAGFIDLLIVMALSRLPDTLGFSTACGYILIRDGLFQGRSPGKKLIGGRVSLLEGPGPMGYRESIIRNITFAAAYILLLIPYAGWLLGSAAFLIEALVALGDERGMRIGDMLANTWVVQPKTEKDTAHVPASQNADPPANTGEIHGPLS